MNTERWWLSWVASFKLRFGLGYVVCTPHVHPGWRVGLAICLCCFVCEEGACGVVVFVCAREQASVPGLALPVPLPRPVSQPHVLLLLWVLVPL